MAAIELHHISKAFARPKDSPVAALAEVSLTVAEGELFVLLGPSGCGKTTLLRVIAGLEEPDGGTVRLGGADQRGVPAGERNVAMVFQNLALYPHLTSAENLGFGLRLRGTARDEIAGRVAEMAGLLGLRDCLTRRPADLSGGQRQRVALGRALIRRPAVLLLDEPFAQLDAPLRRELRRELRQLQPALRCAIVLVTHDQAEALTLGRRVGVMRAGRLLQADAPAELLARPADDFVRDFLDARPV